MKREHLEGIVLQKTHYSESSLILKLLTDRNGIQSFIFQGAKRKHKNGQLISPLAILSVDYSIRGDSQLGKIHHITPALVYQAIPFDPYKSSSVFFVNEVLLKTVKEAAIDTTMYHFLRNALVLLDTSERVANFPIWFLYQFTRYLGVYPQEDSNGIYLDLQEGRYVPSPPLHPLYLSREKSSILKTVSGMKFGDAHEFRLSLDIRRELVNDLLRYYRTLFDHFSEIKSVGVLEAVFHD